jgi:uncharacterized protein (TIGR00730 family)
MTRQGSTEERGDPGGGGRSLAMCVFCGSRAGSLPEVRDVARQLGELIGRRGHQLVYGSGGSGLMADVAWAAWEHGAAVTGYTPQFLYERERGAVQPPQSVHVTEDIFERKRRMLEHADAFVALPGGYGTLDEILEVLSLSYMGMCGKPMILLNIGNFWAKLEEFARSLYELGFADRGPGALFTVVDTSAEAISLAEKLAGDRMVVPGGAL